MRQFLLPRWYAGEPRITLAGEDFHYLARVLRMREGEDCPAVDSRGRRYRMLLVRRGRSEAEAEITAEDSADAPLPAAPEITLLQCLPKGRKIDLIVRQATEAGVVRIIPLFSENSVVRPGQDDARRIRLQRIAREALQQSGNARLPEIEEPRSLVSITEEGADWGTALLFHEQPLSSSTSLHRLLAERPRAVSMIIGPEGGLSSGEVELLRAAGFHLVHLGGNVLRVETAALYAIGAVKTILQERDEWTSAQGK
jgi:16S rRNA (uracil1498-N3)-methyltransferase